MWYPAAPPVERRPRHRLLYLLVLQLLALLAAAPLRAQDRAFVGNDYVTAAVITERNAANAGGGRFYISAGPAHGGPLFLYRVTSNVVFKIVMGGSTFYYTNAASGGGGLGRPKIGGVGGAQEVQYVTYDSIYTSPDTIAVVWSKLTGYTITMRLIPERPTSGYDDGADVLVEFSYQVVPFAPASDLGIFMMLDTYNGQASNSGGQNDFTSIITNRGYFQVEGRGKLYIPPADTIPDFYHVGNFLYQEPLNTILPIHRLKGFSHNGTPLTTPSLFAIGDWQNVLRFLSWDVTTADVEANSFHDCATVLRWDHLAGAGTVRTAFGMNNKTGNDMFHCRDSSLFVDIRAPRVIEQKVKDGAYSPAQFDIDAWVTNTGRRPIDTLVITLPEPIGGAAGRGRLTLDPSTPGAQRTSLKVAETKHLRWRVNLAPGTNDSLLDVPLKFLYQYDADNQPRGFRLPCEPIITIRAYHPPIVHVDTIPPLIISTPPVLKPKPLFFYIIRDRRPGYFLDTGLDSIGIEVNDNGNFDIALAPLPFKRCDISVDVGLRLQVKDTNRPARAIFWARDCRGNVSRDSIKYDPRPDPYKPEVVLTDSLGSIGPPCNTRSFTVYLRDSEHQTGMFGDLGFGSVSFVGTPANFLPLVINPDKGSAAIKSFDPRASFRLDVADSMLDGMAKVRVVDYAGNADTLAFNYCTIPDTKAPVTSVTAVSNPTPGLAPVRWSVHASDTRAWDRGLAPVRVLGSNNMVLQAPTITPGDSTADFSVGVVFDSLPADITVEVSDLRYAVVPQGHADTLHFVYDAVPDTLAPNITFSPVSGFNGTVVDVAVDDIHMFGTTLYRFDRGLMTINAVPHSANIRVSPASPVSFSAGARSTLFRVEVLDTLVDADADTICIEATDLFGNKSQACYYYPIVPDTRSPVLTGGISADRSTLSIAVADDRIYDRGIGSIVLEDPVNIDGPLSLTGLQGVHNATAQYTVTDSARPVSGTLVIRDLAGDRDQSSAVHTVRVPFLLPVVSLHLALPMMVGQHQQLGVAIVALDSLPAALVNSISFDVAYRGEADYTGTSDGLATTSAVKGAGTLSVRLMPSSGAGTILPGDTLGMLVFTTRGRSTIEEFSLTADGSTMVVNDGLNSSVTVTPPGDALSSVLTLPPPFFKLLTDSVSYVDGTCQQILVSTGLRSALKGLAVLGIRPQPATATGGSMVELDIRDLPEEGARAELVSSDGRKVTTFDLPGSGAKVTRVAIRLPQGLSSGAYFLRLRAGGDDAWTKLVVVQ